jgi:hypothetical protein
MDLPFNMRLVFTHLISQYMERLLTGPPGRMFKKTWLYFELMICDKYRGKNTGPQFVKMSQPEYDTSFTPNGKHHI